MTEHNKISETERTVVYQQKDSSCSLTMVFNKDIKTVDISQSIFIGNSDSEPVLVPMESKGNKHSAKYGHWQTISPTLGMENIEFIHKKSKELFEQTK